MKTKTNTLLGAILFLLVISAAAPRAYGQGNLVSWGSNIITGGGKFLKEGGKRTFGFVAKVQGTGVQGNLEFRDHEASMNVQYQIMQMVYAPDSTDGYFGGTCTVNGVGGYTFLVQIHDRGQTGNTDDFTIWILDSLNNPMYTAGAPLSGGNIVIHGY